MEVDLTKESAIIPMGRYNELLELESNLEKTKLEYLNQLSGFHFRTDFTPRSWSVEVGYHYPSLYFKNSFYMKEDESYQSIKDVILELSDKHGSLIKESDTLKLKYAGTISEFETKKLFWSSIEKKWWYKLCIIFF